MLSRNETILSLLLLVSGAAFAQDYKDPKSVDKNVRQTLTREAQDTGATKASVAEQKKALAKCVGDAAPDLDRWEAMILLAMEQESPPAVTDGEVLEALRYNAVERFFESVKRLCDKSPDGARRAVKLADGELTNACERVVAMTEDGCLSVRSCAGGKTETRCNSTLQAVHRMKDPKGFNHLYQRPFTNLHSIYSGISHRECCYGQANCHGTAQALAGGFLDHTPVSDVMIPPAYEKDCRAIGDELYARARARGGRVQPWVSDFEVEPGGVTVNMKYSGCGENDCGKTSLYLMWCTGGTPYAVSFTDGMCISCWEKHLHRVGFTTLAENAGWRDLSPGCILNMNDHSVTLVMRSAGMCYYYESPSPGAAPQLLVSPCPAVWEKFPRRYCPKQPLVISPR